MIINIDTFKAEDCILSDVEIRRIDYLDYLNDISQPFRDQFSEEETGLNKEKDFITISLGYNCNPAIFTRQYGVRTYAFPFDWCFTPYRSLCRIIDTNFKDFFKKENLVPSLKKYFSTYMQEFFNSVGHTEVSENYTWVLDKECEMVFNHDFIPNSFTEINKSYIYNYNKYMRRVKRFYYEINSGKHVYFIRYRDITKQEASKLCQLLKDKFPNTNFTLIVIGVDPTEFAEDWHVAHIKNLYLNNDDFWQKLCKDIVAGVLK